MVNLSESGNNRTIQEVHCGPFLIGTYQNIIILAINIPLSVTAFVGNVLIIVALSNVQSSLHPPSKLLLGCLASTDLCVGLLSHPVYIAYLMSPENSKYCYYSEILYKMTGISFPGVSVITLTVVSMDRLLALKLGLRYREVVTLRRVRVFVATFWLFYTALAIISQYNLPIVMCIVWVALSLCIVTSTVCYTKIYLTLRHHQAQVQDHVHQGQLNREGNPLNTARYRKTVSSALWVQIAFLACYLPHSTCLIVAFIGLRTSLTMLALDVTYVLALSNSTMNPFLYCWKIREVRQAVKDTIKKLDCFST